MFLNKALKSVATPAAGLAFAMAALAYSPVLGAPVEAPGEGAAKSGPPAHAARGKRGDADGDGIADALAAKLLDAAPGEFFDVIVVFDGPRASERARAVAGPFQIGRKFSLIHGFQARMPAAKIWALSNAPGLVRIEENGTVRGNDAPSNDDTGVTQASSTFLVDGSGVTVCVLDTGINPGHEQFDGRVWGPGDFMDFTPNNNQSPHDDVGHGSHVAGILAGDGDGAETVIAPAAEGVAPGATLRIGKVLDATGAGADAWVIGGIEWCAGVADVVSMSLGGDPTDGSDPLSLAVNCAADPGYSVSCGGGDPVIVVVSAGNSGAEPSTVGTPGVAVNSIAVGSFAEWSGDPADAWHDDGVYLNPFSGRGPVVDAADTPLWMKPDIVGPGSRVLSAYINSPDPAQQVPDIYAVADGTSMSTPFVSGVIALMLEADPSLGVWTPGGPDPRLPHQKVRDLLATTAVDVGPAGQDNEYGHGLIDAMAAVAAAAGSPGGATDYPLLPPIAGTVSNFGNWTHEFDVSQDYVDQTLPIAAHVTIEGECNNGIWEPFFGTECLAGISFWDPDLDMIVERNTGGANWVQVDADVDPVSGIGEVTLSECPARGECWNSVGRVEVVHFIPDVAGLHRVRVMPFGDAPNNGTGGDFSFELSLFDAGPVGNTPPNASFSSSCNEQACSFTDTSSDDGTIVSWSWDFGDGNMSSLQSPSHDFGTGGDFTVQLTVTDDGGLSDVASALVTVAYPPPVASFSYQCADLSCAFTDTSTGDLAITSWSWEFGDGNTSPSQNPNYNYGSAGDYTVTLTVTDTALRTGVSSQNISVTAGNAAPVADFSFVCTFLDCTFTDLSSDGDGTVAGWSWTFGDGGSATTQNPSNSYPTAGTYNVTLVATDDDGATNAISKSVTVTAPPPPEIHVGDLDGFATPGDKNRWDATVVIRVDLADETPVAFATVTGSWSGGANGGGTCETDASGTCSIDKNNNKPNVSSVVFTVTSVTGVDATYAPGGNHDVDGGSDGTTITILSDGPPPNQPPTASFADSCTDLSCSFTDTSTDDGTITGWSWNFGDGVGSTSQNPNHTYAEPGIYLVTLVATDNEGADGQTSREVAAGVNTPPTASFSDDCTNLSCNFGDTSTDSDGTIVSWSWDFGDGTTSTSQNPTHPFTSAGSYVVSLTVTDNEGAPDSTDRSITVSEGGGIALSLSTRKVKGVQHVDLTWSGATSATVDIKRGGGTVATVANPTAPAEGTYTDNIGAKGGGSYVYEVCEAGTSICSDPVDAVF